MKRFDLRLPILGSLLASVLATGCGQADQTQVSTNFYYAEAAQEVPADFDRIARGLSAGALDEVRHVGERLIEVFDRSEESVERYAYRERIATDGNGNYSIRFVEGVTALEPDASTFGLLHFQRQGLNYRYRDFAIRDRELFGRNYTMQRRDETEEVAGRACTVYDVRHGSGRAYEVAVDDETGVALRYLERDAVGNVLSTMQYESFSTEPAPSTVYHQSLLVEEPVAWTNAARQELTREGALQPRLAPRGYQLHESTTLQDADGKRWLKLEYTDGVESAFFLSAMPGPTQAQVASNTGADEAVVFRMGAANVVQANLRGRELIAVGKVSERELLDLLESSLP